MYQDEYDDLKYIRQRWDCDSCGEKYFTAGHIENNRFKTGKNYTGKLPYRLSEWYCSANDVVYLAEGEKCCDILRHRFLKQSTSVEKWDAETAKYFTGFKVIIIADRDQPGRIKAETAKAVLDAAGVKNQIIQHDDENTNDIADYFNAENLYW